LIASNVADLHGDQQRDRNNIQRATALNARGNEIPGNEHDILTGSDSLGRAFADGIDHTCNNWTSDGMTLPQANPNLPPDRARHAWSHGPHRRPGHVVECCAYEPGVQQAGAQQHRRRGQDLLLRHRLKEGTNVRTRLLSRCFFLQRRAEVTVGSQLRDSGARFRCSISGRRR